MSAPYMLYITMLTDGLETLRRVQLAHASFRLDHAQCFHVRALSRTVVQRSDSARTYYAQRLPNGRADGRDVECFKSYCNIYKYYVNGMQHGVQTVWRISPVQLIQRYTCYNNEMHGVYESWNRDGSVHERLAINSRESCGLHGIVLKMRAGIYGALALALA